MRHERRLVVARIAHAVPCHGHAADRDGQTVTIGRLTGLLGTHLWASWGLKVALDRFPRTTFAVAKYGLVWGVIEKVMRGELADVTAARGVVRAPLKMLAMLGSVAGNPGQAFREA